mmetsp:Transcript_92471/g.261221  ORF Transcript_92471/g.261221 Transcript_92471/m.261221 type:complete len:285 (+) Transcript_92471:1076-1930(+)
MFLFTSPRLLFLLQASLPLVHKLLLFLFLPFSVGAFRTQVLSAPLLFACPLLHVPPLLRVSLALLIFSSPPILLSSPPRFLILSSFLLQFSSRYLFFSPPRLLPTPVALAKTTLRFFLVPGPFDCALLLPPPIVFAALALSPAQLHHALLVPPPIAIAALALLPAQSNGTLLLSPPNIVPSPVLLLAQSNGTLLLSPPYIILSPVLVVDTIMKVAMDAATTAANGGRRKGSPARTWRRRYRQSIHIDGFRNLPLTIVHWLRPSPTALKLLLAPPALLHFQLQLF